MVYKIISGILIFGILTSSITAQHDHRWCGTHEHKSSFLKAFQANPSAYMNLARSNEELVLPLTIHSVGQSNGEGHVEEHLIMEMLCQLNSDFAPYNISFYLPNEIRKINDDRYYDHTSSSIGASMISRNNVFRTLNVYLVNTGPENVLGYYSQNVDGIVVIKRTVAADDHTITHELGHMFDLPHTFFGWESSTYVPEEPAPKTLGVQGRDTIFVELEDGSNCQIAGDGFCDTKPDYLSYGWTCNSDGLSQTVQKDPSGVEFRSDGTNYMTYSANACQSMFSTEQVAAMRAHIERIRANMLLNPLFAIQDVRDDDVKLTFPLEGQDVRFDDVRLEWDFVTNATSYMVEVSKFNFFPNVDARIFTENNSVTLELPIDRTYHWRIKPFSNFDYCAEYSESASFRTATTTNANNFSSEVDIQVFPSLLETGQDLVIEASFPSSEPLLIQVQTLNGQNIVHQDLPINTHHQYIYNTSTLTPGLYLVNISNGLGRATSKIIVQ